jgi:putative N6-adenine-specific DNA methylase
MDLFVVCAPGLEAVAAAEVAALGLAGRAVPGGVELQGDLRTVARLNLWLRTASRVVARLGSFTAKTFPELVHKAKELPWEVALLPRAPAALRVTCRKSKLYHSDAVAQRLRVALEARLGAPSPEAAEDDPSAQLFLARFDNDVCTVSADTSGALLHQRGYRLAPGPAPLRETLAAALLLSAGWDGSVPLCDPLCGAGTIAIEGALIAAGRAPGAGRAFAFQRWAKAPPLPDLPPARAVTCSIEASDLDAAAMAAARANAKRAGVEISFEQRALKDLPPREGRGLVATNPPYGVRVEPGARVEASGSRGEASGSRDLDALYRELGATLRARRPDWQLAAVVPQERLGRAIGSPLRRLLKTQNGGLPIELLLAEPH